MLDKFSEAFGESEGLSIEEVKNELRNEGVGVEETLNRLKKMQHDISMKAKMGK